MTDANDQSPLVAAMVQRPSSRSAQVEDTKLVRAWKIVAKVQGGLVAAAGVIALLLSFAIMGAEQEGGLALFLVSLLVLLSAPLAFLVPFTVAVALARSERMAADLAKLAS